MSGDLNEIGGFFLAILLCKRFADVLQKVMSTEKNNVRVVFHHLPLSIHPWARTAAEGASCAQLQSATAFWAIHDQLFHKQDEITNDNIKTKLIEFASKTAGLDINDFQNCLRNEMSLGLVFRDMNLASANDVNATPTIFINGRRVQGVKDDIQLRQLITEALVNKADVK